jgi:peptide/nickel transport system permease protein
MMPVCGCVAASSRSASHDARPGAIGARLAKTVAVILLIATVNFMLVHAAPGDPALVIAGQSGATDQKFLDTLRAEYGLDRPVAVQLGTYLAKVVRFDLGFSYRQQRPVLDLILERLPATLLLTVTAFSLALVGGTLLGLIAGTRAGRWSDTRSRSCRSSSTPRRSSGSGSSWC